MNNINSNSGNFQNPNDADNEYYEVWQEILKCKENFIKGTEDPRINPYVRPEVALSWIRSRNLGITSNSSVFDHKLSAEEFKKIAEANRMIIDVVAPLFETFKKIVSNAHIVLYDKNGVILLMKGNISSVPIDIEILGAEGFVFSEETVGTSSSSLSRFLKKPIQISGPEFYHPEFIDVLCASSAPVVDEKGDVIATLSVITRLEHKPRAPQDCCSKAQRTTSLAMIAAMALSIESKLRLQKSYDRLTNAYDTLNTTLSFIDEGIITVDRTGKLIQANDEGAGILKISSDEIKNKNIVEFLSASSILMDLVNEGAAYNRDEPIITGCGEQTYFINAKPVINDETKHVSGAVLRLTPSDKINAFVTHRSGAKAYINFEDIIGESSEFKNTIALAERFANASENVLLIGESGTGKELFAQAMHNRHRPNGPFIAVNCAAIPKNLIEAELFGYEGGSFTGADRCGRPGKIELSNGGTLFLDEIGDMPFELQAVLLRVLQDKLVTRIGAKQGKRVDFRIIAATNKDIYKMVEEKLFRDDLYFRLSVLSVVIPPLRDRDNDAEILSQYFLTNSYHKQRGKEKQLSPAALKIIREYKWPGNVRQLENAVIYAINVSSGNIIEPEHLPNFAYSSRPEQPITKFKEREHSKEIVSLKDLEKAAIENALLECNYNITHTAGKLGISKNTLYNKMKDYGISKSHSDLAK